jgi:hypothetical protein
MNNNKKLTVGILSLALTTLLIVVAVTTTSTSVFADECIWPQCYYPYDNNQQYGTDDNCKAPQCLISLNQGEPNPAPQQQQLQPTKKFNVQILLDHARKEQYQVRVIVYGVNTLNKPTLDKPGVTIYASQCMGECSINAGIWSFTDSKVNNGDSIKACAINVATRNEYCGNGSADKSRTDTIHIPIYSTAPGETKSANINFKAACDIISPALYHPCSWYVNPNGSLTKEGQRAYDCIKNGFGLGVGGLVITEGNIPLVITGLGLLSGFTGCENVVHLELLSGVLDTVGKINSVKSALNIR